MSNKGRDAPKRTYWKKKNLQIACGYTLCDGKSHCVCAAIYQPKKMNSNLQKKNKIWKQQNINGKAERKRARMPQQQNRIYGGNGSERVNTFCWENLNGRKKKICFKRTQTRRWTRPFIWTKREMQTGDDDVIAIPRTHRTQAIKMI